MRSVPFYANTEDDTHCFQSALRMILKYFQPEQEYSWAQLEQLTGKLEGKSTWPQQSLLSLAAFGFEAVQIEGFDAAAFISRGSEYLYEAFGKETADWQVRWSDVPREQELYRQALESPQVHMEHQIPTIDDMARCLRNGYLITCNVNSKKINDAEGYVGHSIVVYDVAPEWVTFHDPGLPPLPGRRVSRAGFEAAWAYPNQEAKILIAIRPAV